MAERKTKSTNSKTAATKASTTAAPTKRRGRPRKENLAEVEQSSAKINKAIKEPAKKRERRYLKKSHARKRYYL